MIPNRLVTVVVLVVALSNPLLGQFKDSMVCGHSGEDGEVLMKSSENKRFFIDPTPTYDGINFNVAVLYFKAADDTWTNGNCRVEEWPPGSQEPNWKGELLINTRYNAATVTADTAAKPYSITTYFYHLSGGRIWIYGNEITYTGTPINMETNQTEWRSINGQIHQWFIDNHDLRSLDNDGNGEVDMIVFVNRARMNFGFQGIAANYLPTGTISDAADPGEPVIRGDTWVIANSGVYQRGVYDIVERNIIFHEMGHQLRQGGHINGLHRWNLMSGAGPNPPRWSGIVLSAWEKNELGWLDLIEITDNRIGYELEDISSSGNAIKIPVNSSDYFILEHRKNRNRFELITNSCLTSPGLAEGLLISYSRNNAEPSIRPADGTVTNVGTPANPRFDGDATDLFPNGGITEITPYTTTENTDDHNGNPTHIAITNIHYNGDNIIFDIYQKHWSDSQLATANNSGWKIVRDSNGDYHVVYQSGNRIQYVKYSGGSWEQSITLSDVTHQCGYPAVTERSDNVYVTWQRINGNNHDIYFHLSTDSGDTWSSANRQVIASNVGASDSLPVIASPSSNNVVVAYRQGGNIESKHSSNNGGSWSTKTISGSALNSPSVAPGKTPWGANSTVLAYATAEIPNTSDIEAQYYYNGWTSTKNLTSNLPSNLSQHAHPSIAFSGDFTQNKTHVAWDAYDSFRYARVILHKVMSSFNNPSTYYQFAYQTEDRPSITGLAGARAAMIFCRGSANYFSGTYNGSSWNIPLSAPAGKHPSMSLGGTVAKYVITSGSSAPFKVEFSSSLLTKLGPLASEGEGDFKTVRAVGLVDSKTGAWLNVRVEDFLVKHSDDSYSWVDFSRAPADTAVLSFNEAWAALCSEEFALPANADSLIIVLSAAGENVTNFSDGSAPLELLFKSQKSGDESSAKHFQTLTFASDASFKQTDLHIGVSVKELISGSLLVFKPDVRNEKTGSSIVVSLGHIYEYAGSQESSARKLTADHTTIVKPDNFELQQNYPNPFNPETTIKYQVEAAAQVTLEIYNFRGQQIRTLVNEVQPSGHYQVSWGGKDALGQPVASGVYIYRQQAG